MKRDHMKNYPMKKAHWRNGINKIVRCNEDIRIRLLDTCWIQYDINRTRVMIFRFPIGPIVALCFPQAEKIYIAEQNLRDTYLY